MRFGDHKVENCLQLLLKYENLSFRPDDLIFCTELQLWGQRIYAQQIRWLKFDIIMTAIPIRIDVKVFCKAFFGTFFCPSISKFAFCES